MSACPRVPARPLSLLLIGTATAGLVAFQLAAPASGTASRGASNTADDAPAVSVAVSTATDVATDTPVPMTVALRSTSPLPAGLVALRVDGRRVATADLAGGTKSSRVGVTVPSLSEGDHSVIAVLRSHGRKWGQSSPVTVTADDGGNPPPPPPGPPSSGSNCAPHPSACGFPDATNTGVPAGTTMTTYNHDVEIDTNGTVFQNAVVHGSIDIAADNVTVRNVQIIEDGESWGIGLIHSHNATIQNCDIAPDGARLLVGIKDVYGDATGTTIQGCDIARTTSGIQTHEGLIEDNYIHDMAFKPGDHLNGTTSNGSTVPMTIRHNTILNQHDQTDAISLFQDFGLEANRTITDNLLAGGSYTIYGGGGSYGRSHDIVITDNRISRIYFPDGGTFGPVAHFENGNPGNVWSDNVWDDTGDQISGDD